MQILPITRERYLHHLKWRVRRINPVAHDWYKQFTPIFRERTNAISCVISNGITKNGTNLLDCVVAYFGKWANVEVFINEEDWYLQADPQNHHICLRRFAVKKLRDGQMAAGHLPWEQQLAEAFRQASPNRHPKHVFIYRDPRDQVISIMNSRVYPDNYSYNEGESGPEYAWNPGPADHAKFLLEHFPTADKLLTHHLEMRPWSGYMAYEPWLRDSDCYPIKFEDLYQDVLDLRDNILGDTLRKLLDHLEIDTENLDPVDFYEHVWGKSRNASPEMNKVGQYKRLFKDHHYALIDDSDFRAVLDAFGYEW